MKIEKLPSGSYRVRHQQNGKRYSVTVPYKPGKKEAFQLIQDKINASVTSYKAQGGTFAEYVEKYLSYCENADLSPSTIRGYLSIRNNIPEWFMMENLHDISQEKVQQVCDEYSSTHSPKSVRLFNGFIRSVIGKYRPELTYSVNLPPMTKKAEYEPSTEDIQRILEYATGSRYEIALRLCALGLRRGEVIAITSEDVDKNNVLTINKDIVLDENNNYVMKDKPKTEESNRRILIPGNVADMIRTSGRAFSGNPHTINEYLHKCQDSLNIPRFRLHYLRHFAAAYLHKEGFTDSQILAYGGWSESSDVMKRAYRYNLDPHESQKQIADSFGNIF